MTRKDYVKAAAMIRSRWDTSTDGQRPANEWNAAVLLFAHDLADWFAADNPNFDRQRFLAACGLEE